MGFQLVGTGLFGGYFLLELTAGSEAESPEVVNCTAEVNVLALGCWGWYFALDLVIFLQLQV